MTNDLTEIIAVIAKNRKAIDRLVRASLAEIENESPLPLDDAQAAAKRVAKRYRKLKPMLALLASFGVVPDNWRAVIAVFHHNLDDLVKAAPKLTATAVAESDEFKAGKDL